MPPPAWVLTTPARATDHLGLVGARTARHDREPGGPQLCSGPLVRVRVSLAEEKGHQVTALLAELIAESSFGQLQLLTYLLTYLQALPSEDHHSTS